MSIKYSVDDLPMNVLDSLKNNIRDYCYTMRDLNIILELCKKDKINVTYDIKRNEIGEIEYIELMPCRLLKGKKESYQVNKRDMPEDVKMDSSERPISYYQAYGIKREEPVKYRKHKDDWNNFGLGKTSLNVSYVTVDIEPTSAQKKQIQNQKKSKENIKESTKENTYVI